MTRTLLALFLVISFPVRGAETVATDVDIAREASARGEILPLAEVLRLVQALHPGRVIEVEFEREDGRPLYEIELVTPDGILIEVDADARTGAVIEYGEEEDD